MVRRGKSQAPSDRQKWQKIFDGLVKMLRTQQSQIESLLKERKLLEYGLERQHGRWVSDVRLLEDQISQMKRDLTIQDMSRVLDAARADMLLGLKERDASFYKFKYENIDQELADFRVWFDYLSQKCSNTPDISLKGLNGEEQVMGDSGGSLKSLRRTTRKCAKTWDLKGELERLKHDYEKLSSQTSDKISALSSERNFAWKQFKTMENEYTGKLEHARAELLQSNKKVEKLIGSMEHLQSLNSEKDKNIALLKAEVAELESEKKKRDEELLRVFKELESTRSLRVTTPVTRSHAKLNNLKGGQTGGIGHPNFIMQTASAPKFPERVKDGSEKGSRGLKRKGTPAGLISETPKLFSSSFKVPKLRTHSLA